MKCKKGIYVVNIEDSSGAFLWCKNEDDPPVPHIGSNVYCSLDRVLSTESLIMSRELFNDFFDWVDLYVESVPDDLGWGKALNHYELTGEKIDLEPGPAAVELDFNWESFSETGIQLARRLKEELGTDYRVLYVKPSHDPSQTREGFLEIS